MRARRRDADRSELWLAPLGPLTDSGLRQILMKRSAQAGVAPLHPDALRHFMADAWLRAGGAETDLMRVLGWKSQQMVDRYGAAVAVSRASDCGPKLRRCVFRWLPREIHSFGTSYHRSGGQRQVRPDIAAAHVDVGADDLHPPFPRDVAQGRDPGVVAVTGRHQLAVVAGQ